MRNLFKKRKVETVTNEAIVDLAREQVEGSLSSFARINKEIEEVNEVLKNVIEEETQHIIEAEKTRSKAHQGLIENKSLQEKIQQFLL